MKSKTKDILEWIFCIVIAVILALLVRYFVGTPTEVRQPSMYPTLKEGQRLILNRWIRTTNGEPKRGDIVTFEAPSKFGNNLDTKIADYSDEPTGVFAKFKFYVLEIGKTSYIKRVIALPGETVKIENGKVYVDGEFLNEEYLAADVKTYEKGPFEEVKVPEGCVFVMGDNRGQSTDSRTFGCVPMDKIESKVFIRFWPLNLFGGVE